MITFPGFGDQPLLSNLMVSNGVAKLMKVFTYNDMEPLLDEILIESNYSQMVKRLEVIKREQVKHGGFARGVKVIEDVIEGKIALNRSIAPGDVMGYPFGEMLIIWSMLLVSVVLTLFGIIYGIYKLIRLIIGARKPKKPLSKTD